MAGGRVSSLLQQMLSLRVYCVGVTGGCRHRSLTCSIGDGVRDVIRRLRVPVFVAGAAVVLGTGCAQQAAPTAMTTAMPSRAPAATSAAAAGRRVGQGHRGAWTDRAEWGKETTVPGALPVRSVSSVRAPRRAVAWPRVLRGSGPRLRPSGVRHLTRRGFLIIWNSRSVFGSPEAGGVASVAVMADLHNAPSRSRGLATYHLARAMRANSAPSHDGEVSEKTVLRGLEKDLTRLRPWASRRVLLLRRRSPDSALGPGAQG